MISSAWEGNKVRAITTSVGAAIAFRWTNDQMALDANMVDESEDESIEGGRWNLNKMEIWTFQERKSKYLDLRISKHGYSQESYFDSHKWHHCFVVKR